MNKILSKGQGIKHSGVGSHHQNAVVESSIKTTVYNDRTMRIHSALIFQNATSMIFGLSPSAMPPTCKARPHTCCIKFFLLNCGSAASRVTDTSLMPIHGAALCSFFNIGYGMEERYLGGSLGLDWVNRWVYLHYMPTKLL